jgi:putative phosphoribosyl transferase
MNPLTDDLRAHDRHSAGIRLARKLAFEQLQNPIVVAIPHGGVEVGAAIAGSLNVPLEVMPCRKISDPSNHEKHIGSVSRNEIVLHDCPYSVPQDYLYFKGVRLQSEIDSELRFYREDSQPSNLQYRTVVLVDDILISSDTMIACLREIRAQQPMSIIVAVPFVQTEAARKIQSEADGLVFSVIKPAIATPLEYYEEFPQVTDWRVRELVRQSKVRRQTPPSPDGPAVSLLLDPRHTIQPGRDTKLLDVVTSPG